MKAKSGRWVRIVRNGRVIMVTARSQAASRKAADADAHGKMIVAWGGTIPGQTEK